MFLIKLCTYNTLLYVVLFCVCVKSQHSGMHNSQPNRMQSLPVAAANGTAQGSNDSSSGTHGGGGPPSIFKYWQVRWAMAISEWYLYIVVPVGLVGNICAMVTVTLMPPLTTPTLNIIILGMQDSVLLTVRFIYQVFTDQGVYMGEIGCIVLLVLTRLSAVLSNWQTTWIAIERAVAVLKPFKVGEMFTKFRAIVINVVCLILATIQYIPMMMMTMYDHDSLGLKCGTKPEYMSWLQAYNIFQMITEKIAPMIIVATCSTLIVIGVRKAMREKEKMQEGNKATSQASSVTIMICTVTITFVVLQTVTIAYLSLVIANYRSLGLDVIINVFLLRALAHFLTDLNHAINFFLYVLSGRIFREQFLKVFCFRDKLATDKGNTKIPIA